MKNNPLSRFGLFVGNRILQPKGIRSLVLEAKQIVQKFGWLGLYREICDIAGSSPPTKQASKNYSDWIAIHEADETTDLKANWRRFKKRRHRLKIHILLRVDTETIEDATRVLASVYAQNHESWELSLFVPAASAEDVIAREFDTSRTEPRMSILRYSNHSEYLKLSNQVCQESAADLVVFLTASQVLAPRALAAVALSASQHPDAPFFFADEDHLDETGSRSAPIFKPCWDFELFRAFDYVGDFVCVRRCAFQAEGGLNPSLGHGAGFDLLSRLAASSTHSSPIRLAHVLSHRTTTIQNASGIPEPTPEQEQDLLRARLGDLKRCGIRADIVKGALNTWRICYRLPANPPKVSVIIPTRDRLDLLRQTIEGVLLHTDYSNLEIIVVDNDSIESETLKFLSELENRNNITVLRIGGEFNYSKFNNEAADRATGEVLCLLNNDIKVIHPDWLSEMVARAILKDTGAVGARLLYEDGTVQHAGVILGVCGTAAHAFRFSSPEVAGPLGRLQVPHTKSAVTGACLVVEKRKFLKVGGLNSRNLKVTYNDVDLCLKLGEAGFQTVFTPYATLYHLESASRGGHQSPSQLAMARREVLFFRKKWREHISDDPFYSPNLTRLREDYSIM